MPFAIKIPEPTAQSRIAGWWSKADIHPHYPASTDRVIELLRVAEYEVSNEVLDEFLRKSYIPEPAMRDGRFHWTAAEIVAFATALEQRRRWLPGSQLHASKKIGAELGQELAEQEGRDLYHDLDSFTCEDLALHMVAAEDHGVRLAIYVALKAKGLLRLDGDE